MSRRIVLAAVVCIGLVLSGWHERVRVLTAIGSFVISTDIPVHADAIVVLSGSLPDRILEAVDLYEEGWAPRIVLTEESTRPGLEDLHRRGVDIPQTHDLNISIAEQLGVPREAIVLLDEPANSTVSEADVVLSYLRRVGAKRALIVTSKVHSYRAGIIYAERAGEDVEIVSVASRHDPYRAETWWRSRGYARRLVFEYQKLLVFWLGDRWFGPEAQRAARATPRAEGSPIP